MKEYIKCPECPMCKPQPGKRARGSGCIYKPISSCGMHEKQKGGIE